MKEISILTIFLIVFGCKYEPRGVYERELKQPLNIDITIENLNINSDTIYVYRSEFTLSSRFTTLGKAVGTKLFIDGNLVNESSTNEFLNTFPISAGTHLMKVEYVIGSNSGSIADKLNLERGTYSIEVVIISKPNYIPMHISFIKDGFLNIKLDKYLGSDFLYYEIRDYSSSPKIFKDHNTIVDETFFGKLIPGMGEFIVKVFTKEGYLLDYGRIQLKPYIPEVSFQILENDKVKMSWKKTPYFNTFKNYIIYKNSEYNELLKIDDINDTTRIVDAPAFGETFWYGVSASSSNGIKTDPIGKNFNTSEKLNINLVNNFYYYTKTDNNGFIYSINDTIKLYNLNLKQVTNKLIIPESSLISFQPSPKGKLLLIRSLNRNFYYVETSNLENLNFFIFMNNYENFDLNKTKISDNKICMLGGTNSTYFYDIINKSTSNEFFLEGSAEYQNKISSSGLFFIKKLNSNFEIYGINQNVFAKYFEFPETYTSYINIDQSDNLIYFENSIFEIYSLPNRKLIHRYLTDATRVIDYDINSNLILISNDKTMSILDLSTGKTIKKLKAPLNYGNGYYLIGNTIVTNNGYVLYN